jgi:hypothetical protein
VIDVKGGFLAPLPEAPLVEAEGWTETALAQGESVWTLNGALPSHGSFALRASFSPWGEDCWLLMPGAVYGGTRFTLLKDATYPSKAGPEFMVPWPPETVADIPRLSKEAGPSAIEILASSLTFPCAAVFDPGSRSGVIITFPLSSSLGLTGVKFEESEDRSHASLTLTFPGQRHSRYGFPELSTSLPGTERGWEGPLPASALASVGVRVFPCSSPTELIQGVSKLMRASAEGHEIAASLPFSEAKRLIEEHFNRDMWWDEAGLYRASEWDSNPYQTGWCSGIIAQYGLMMDPIEDATEPRCVRHLGEAFSAGMAECGLFYGKRSMTGWASDCHYDAEAMPWRAQATLTRRQGDALLYGLRALELLEHQDRAPIGWEKALRRSADALALLWERERQFGFMLHQEEGRTLQGGSASGAMIPGALAAGGLRWQDQRLMKAAEESAEDLCQRFLDRGFTCGGPSDAAQAPDSESAAALMESCSLLAEATGSEHWAQRGLQAARLFSTWTLASPFRFPDWTEFGKLGMNALGTVMANAQNTHCAPGICTHAGAGLLRLYRQTGEEWLATLCMQIARTLPQYISRSDRPIHDASGKPLPSGWINERVNINDWDNLLGGVFYAPCWPEVSFMITRCDLPGVYMDLTTGRIWALDHVEASWEGESLCLTNRTPFDAEVTALVDARQEPRLVPGWRLQKALVRSGERVLLNPAQFAP